MRLIGPLLEKNDGWLHRATLLDQGWKASQILQARRREGIELFRRKWLVLPDAAPDVQAAAQLGGAITSISALRRYELWVPPSVAEDQRSHIALRTDASTRRETDVVTYRLRPVVDRHPRRLIDPVENVLATIAWRLPPVDALAVWESAVRQRHTSPEILRGLSWTSAAAKALAAATSDRSDSGVESIFVAQCRRAQIPVVQQIWLAGRPVDALIGRRLVVQIDGYAFHRDAAQRRKDIAHDRALVSRGYTVLRFSYHDVVYEWPRIEQEIRTIIARGLAD